MLTTGKAWRCPRCACVEGAIARRYLLHPQQQQVSLYANLSAASREYMLQDTLQPFGPGPAIPLTAVKRQWDIERTEFHSVSGGTPEGADGARTRARG